MSILLRNLGILFTFLIINNTEILSVTSSNNLSQSSFRLCDIAFSPNGGYVVASSENGNITIWDVKTADIQQELVSGPGCANVQFSLDSQYLFTVQSGDMTGEGAVTIIWDVKTGEEIRRFEGRTSISEDGKFVLITTARPEQLFDTSNGELVYPFDQPIHAIPGAIFSPDNQKLISMNFPTQEAELWDIPTGKLLFTFPYENAGWLSVIYFLPDNERVVVGNSNNDVAVWNINSLTVEHTFKGSDNLEFSHFFSINDDVLMLMRDYDGRVEVWEVQTGSLKSTFQTAIDAEVVDSAVPSDGKYLLLGLSSGTAQLWDVDSGMLIKQYSIEGSMDSAENSFVDTRVAFSPDNEKILVGFSGESLYLWDVETGEKRTYAYPSQ